MRDESLFDNMLLPDGINKDNVVDNIFLEGGDFEVLYADPLFMRSAIGVWSKKHYWTFKKWIDAINIEYNPLENYDRIESWGDENNNTRTLNNSDLETRNTQDLRTLDTQDLRTLDTEDKQTLNTQDLRTLDTEDKQTLNTQDQRTLNTTDLRTLDTEDKQTLNTQDQETRNLKDKTTFDKTTGTEHEVSAFDSNVYQPSTKDTEHEGGDVTVDGTGTDTTAHTGTDTMKHTGTDTLGRTGTDTVNRTGTDTTDHTGTDTMNRTGTDTTEHTGTDTVNRTGTDTLNQTGTNKMDHTGTIADLMKSKHNGRIHGNIGVTTSQQMLQSEIDIARFNIVQQITDIFISEFCIMLYD